MKRAIVAGDLRGLLTGFNDTSKVDIINISGVLKL